MAMHLRHAAEQAGLDLSYFLEDFSYVRAKKMPPSLPGLANYEKAVSQQYLLFSIACGGVSVDMIVDKKQFTEVDSPVTDALRDDAVSARPAPDRLSWAIPVP